MKMLGCQYVVAFETDVMYSKFQIPPCPTLKLEAPPLEWGSICQHGSRVSRGTISRERSCLWVGGCGACVPRPTPQSGTKLTILDLREELCSFVGRSPIHSTIFWYYQSPEKEDPGWSVRKGSGPES